MSSGRRFTVRSLGSGDGGERLVAAGELDLASAPALRDALLQALGSGDAVLDMSDVEFCDSAGLRTLIEAHRHAGRHATSFRIAAPSAAVLHTLQLAGALGVLEISDQPVVEN